MKSNLDRSVTHRKQDANPKNLRLEPDVPETSRDKMRLRCDIVACNKDESPRRVVEVQDPGLGQAGEELDVRECRNTPA